MGIVKKFDRQLRNLLYISGVERDELAHNLGVPVFMVKRWTEGARVPDVYQLQKIARYFGVSYTWLLDGADTDTKQLAERLNMSEEVVKAMLCMADSEYMEVMQSAEDAVWAVFSAVTATHDMTGGIAGKKEWRKAHEAV